MKYKQFVGAVPTFQKLVSQDLPLSVAYRLHKMIRRINEELGFFNARREQIVTSDAPEGEKSTQIAELLEFEAEWDPEPIRIPIDTGINLSCADLDALEGLVEFYEEEDHERDHDQRAE